MRDEFAAAVKNLIAKRVGFRCSNPGCRKLTSGPGVDPGSSINVGVAAHITAASPGGPRYQGEWASADRTSAGNGVWLCQTCAKLVDSDTNRYSIEELSEWKRLAELSALAELEGRLKVKAYEQDDDVPLRLVDIVIVNDSNWGPVTLEIKVRNVGLEVAFIKRAQFEVLKVAELCNPILGAYNFIKVAHEYHIRFSPELEGKIAEMNVAQAVSPGNVDRFEFKIGLEGGDPGFPCLCHFRLRLLYNEDDRLLESQPITIALFSQNAALGFTAMGIVPMIDEIISNENFSAAAEFSRLPGLYSEKAKRLIDAIVEARSASFWESGFWLCT